MVKFPAPSLEGSIRGPAAEGEALRIYTYIYIYVYTYMCVYVCICICICSKALVVVAGAGHLLERLDAAGGSCVLGGGTVIRAREIYDK